VDYLLHSGSPAAVSYFRQHVYLIKTLGEFQCIDDTGRDVGKDVRLRARDISRLLQDSALLEKNRHRRQETHTRLVSGEPTNTTHRVPNGKPQQYRDLEEEELHRAIRLNAQIADAHEAQLTITNKIGLFDETLVTRGQCVN
jgi:epsin